MASKPIKVRLTKDAGGFLKGAELGYATEAKATSVLGEGTFTVVSYQDGSPYEAPKSKSDAKKDEK